MHSSLVLVTIHSLPPCPIPYIIRLDLSAYSFFKLISVLVLACFLGKLLRPTLPYNLPDLELA